MANRAYLRVWTRDFNEETMIAQFARFLTTAPVTEAGPGFEQLIVQPIDSTETPIAEWDLKTGKFGAAEVAALAALNLAPDTAYIVDAKWALWNFDIATLKWKQVPLPLELRCHGRLYDDGIAASTGNFLVDLGFEHLFTGHAGLLAPSTAKNPFEISDHPLEKTFRSWMSSGE